MSDTPRTNNYIENFPGSRREPRLLDFARRLERELDEARAEIERLKCCTNCGSRLWAATGKGNCKNCKDFSAWTSQGEAALAAERGE